MVVLLILGIVCMIMGVMLGVMAFLPSDKGRSSGKTENVPSDQIALTEENHSDEDN